MYNEVNTCAYGSTYTVDNGLCSSDAVTCKYTTATEAASDLCCCDTINTYTTINTGYVQETKTNLPEMHINWDTVNQRYEINWDKGEELCGNPVEEKSSSIYKASRKFKKIIIK